MVKDRLTPALKKDVNSWPCGRPQPCGTPQTRGGDHGENGYWGVSLTDAADEYSGASVYDPGAVVGNDSYF